MGKTNICRSVRRWLLLLLLLPASVCAKGVSQAMLYIEKTDGSVVQIPITTGYPVLRHTFSYEGDKMVPSLDVTYKLQEVQFMIIPHAQIRRFYTGFETSGIVEMESSGDLLEEEVWTLDGKYLGKGARVLEAQPKGIYVVKKGMDIKKTVRP